MIQRAPTDGQRDPTMKWVAGDVKGLSTGIMSWDMWTIEHSHYVAMSITFMPLPKYRGKTVTFIQTLEESSRFGNPDKVLDVFTYGYRGSTIDNFAPFSGAGWSNKDRKWVAEADTVPPQGFKPRKGFKNQPSSASDPYAYFYDEPIVHPGETKMFETAVVVAETTEVLASMTWGAEGCSENIDTKYGLAVCQPKPILPPSSEPSDRPTAGFLVTVDRSYEQPSTIGPNPLPGRCPATC